MYRIEAIFASFMKKIIITIVAACYLVVTCGVVVNFHFCMDRLASTSLFVSQEKKCGRCGMEIHESNGCCRDEVQIIKMEEDQTQTNAIAYDFSNVGSPVITPSFYIVAEFEVPNISKHFHNHSPPLLSEQDSYLQHSVFRI